MTTAQVEAVALGVTSTAFVGWGLLLIRQGKRSGAIGILGAAVVGYVLTFLAAIGVTFTGA
jgi:hypothetical protein